MAGDMGRYVVLTHHAYGFALRGRLERVFLVAALRGEGARCCDRAARFSEPGGRRDDDSGLGLGDS